MSNARVSGWSGIAFLGIQVLSTILYFLGGVPPAADDPVKQVAYAAQNATLHLTVAIVSAIGAIAFLSYALGIRGMLLAAGRELDRAAAATWGTGLVLAAVMIVASSVLAAGALDASSRPDGSVIRAFDEFELVITTLGAVVIVVFLAAAAKGTLDAAAFPRWTAYVARIAAVLNFVSIFALYLGATAGGLLAFFAGFVPFLVYVAATSVVMLRMPVAIRAAAPA